MNRKASLNLSIQAIVIIVLAMTILGLGLGFVRGLFDNIVGISESTFQKITEQLSTDLATSSAPLLFSQTKLNMERGKSDLQGFGVRNDGNAKIKYGFNIETNTCPEKEDDGSCLDADEWFAYLKGPEQYTLSPAERQANKVQITIPRGVTTGLYLLKMSAYLGNWPSGGNCVDDYEPTTGAGCSLIGQTELFLTVS